MYMNELIRLLEEMNRFFKLFHDTSGKNVDTKALIQSNVQSIKDMAISEHEIIFQAAVGEQKETVEKILSGIQEFIDAADHNDMLW